MNKLLTTIAAIAAVTVATQGSSAMEPDQLIEHTEFLTDQSPVLANDFPKDLLQWTEEQLSYAVDPVDEMIGAPSEEIIELARRAFDHHVTNDYKRKMKLWCLDFYEGAAKHMVRTGEEINADALPVFLEKEAAKAFSSKYTKACPSKSVMQRWFVRYASMQLEFIAAKWKQINNEELFASNAVNAFNNWRKEYRKELTALQATAVKVANKSNTN